MKVPYVEDLANHSSPESCGWCSNGLAEALTGESVGGLLSSEITSIWVPTPCTEGEGHADSSDICELLKDLAESKNLACVDASHAGIRRSERNPTQRNWNGGIQLTKISWCIEGRPNSKKNWCQASKSVNQIENPILKKSTPLP